jgi:hypothetical protein
VVFVEVRFGNLRGVVGSEYFDFDDVMVVFSSRHYMLTTEITGNV